MKHEGQPTLILAKTVKGYGMGSVGEGKNIAHQQKKMPLEALRQFRDRFKIPVPDDQLADIPYYRPAPDSPEANYLKELRAKLGGPLPQRRRKSSAKLEAPKPDAFKPLLEATAEGREISTTMAFVRLLTGLVKDKTLGKHIVPIVPDESRTFGMEGLFRQLGIYSRLGQLYEPEDSDQLMFYKEDKNGQILQEGINEAGAMCSWLAAGTSYTNSDAPMIPFYIFYSMFGFQRIGDLCWAAGDLRARGFLMGATSGRTTLNGEGLQHEDGHSHIMAGTIPNCVAYDPTFAYELAVIIQEGLRRMSEEQEDIFYYITVMNENYAHGALPEGAREGILKGMYKFSDGGASKGPRAQLLGSGVILREVIAAAELLKNDWGVTADVWSCPSFNELGREGREIMRWNMLHPTEKQKVAWVTKCLGDTKGPVVASSDYVREFADQIRELVPRRYKVLGTDGFGRSDSRKNLRQFFEVNRFYVAVAALKALADDGEVPAAKVAEAIKKYGLDTERPAPWTV
jgi:pyruvate dehydrogenase E1 component